MVLPLLCASGLFCLGALVIRSAGKADRQDAALFRPGPRTVYAVHFKDDRGLWGFEGLYSTEEAAEQRILERLARKGRAEAKIETVALHDGLLPEDG